MEPGRITRSVVPQGKTEPRLLTFVQTIPFGFQKLFSQSTEKFAQALLDTEATGTILKQGALVAEALMGGVSKTVLLALRQTGLEESMHTIAQSTARQFIALQSGKGVNRERLTEFALKGITHTFDGLHGLIASRFGGKPYSAAPEVEPYYATAMKRTEDSFLIEKLRIGIQGPGGVAYAYVPVTLFSLPKKAVTDKDGIVEFKNIETGEHALEIHLDNNFIVHKALILDPPAGLDLAEGEPVDVIIPLINVRVEDLHGAAPEKLQYDLFTRAVILTTLLSMILLQISLLILLFRKRERAVEVKREVVGQV